MARLLLIDFDEQFSSTLASAMKQHRHLITVCATSRRAIEAINLDGGNFEVVLLDLSLDRREDWEILDHLCKRIAGKTIAPAILCFSRIYRGVRMRLEARRRGARFIYVH
jgi:ActR/RegA family two-component response regulator